MSSNGDAAPRRWYVRCSPTPMKKGVTKHAHAKGNKRDEQRRKRKKMPSSSSSSSSSLDYSPPSFPSSSKDEESDSSPK